MQGWVLAEAGVLHECCEDLDVCLMILTGKMQAMGLQAIKNEAMGKQISPAAQAPAPPRILPG